MLLYIGKGGTIEFYTIPQNNVVINTTLYGFRYLMRWLEEVDGVVCNTMI